MRKGAERAGSGNTMICPGIEHGIARESPVWISDANKCPGTGERQERAEGPRSVVNSSCALAFTHDKAWASTEWRRRASTALEQRQSASAVAAPVAYSQDRKHASKLKMSDSCRSQRCERFV